MEKFFPVRPIKVSINYILLFNYELIFFLYLIAQCSELVFIAIDAFKSVEGFFLRFLVFELFLYFLMDRKEETTKKDRLGL